MDAELVDKIRDDEIVELIVDRILAAPVEAETTASEEDELPRQAHGQEAASTKYACLQAASTSTLAQKQAQAAAASLAGNIGVAAIGSAILSSKRTGDARRRLV